MNTEEAGWPPAYLQVLLHFVLHFGCFRRFCHRCRSMNMVLKKWVRLLPLPHRSLYSYLKITTYRDMIAEAYPILKPVYIYRLSLKSFLINIIYMIRLRLLLGMIKSWSGFPPESVSSFLMISTLEAQ